MSRIYDALKKEELEGQVRSRTCFPLPIDEVVFGSTLPPKPVSASPMEFESEERVKRLSWNLNLSKLPALRATDHVGEVFRKLRSRLLELRDEKTFKSFLITSGLPGEGKTFIATNLALTLAGRDNSRVLLIDGDLRRPSVHAILGADPKPGFAEYLAGAAELAEIMQHGPIPNLAFIPGGHGAENAAELVVNGKTEELVARITDEFDWIIVDSSPVIPVSDPVNLARSCDAVLLVTRAISTPYPITQKVKKELSGSRVLGVVLNGVEDASSANGYYYGYAASDVARQTAG